MAKYRARPVEIEARLWPVTGNLAEAAQIIADWVNENSGRARVEDYTSTRSDIHIRIHTINGWASAHPGHYIVLGDTVFTSLGRRIVDFYPCDPKTFEKRWEEIPTVPFDL